MSSQNGAEDDRPTVMGIDPGLTGLAVCCATPAVDGADFEVQLFTSKPRGDSVRARIDRYCELADLVMQVTDRFHPSLVLLEGYSYASQGSSKTLAEFGGVLRTELCELDADILEVSPMTLKKFATGKGSGNKIQMVAAITLRWGVGFGTDDEYDAYALARMGACIGHLIEPDTMAQREAIQTVLNGRKPKGGGRSADTSHATVTGG